MGQNAKSSKVYSSYEKKMWHKSNDSQVSDSRAIMALLFVGLPYIHIIQSEGEEKKNGVWVDTQIGF